MAQTIKKSALIYFLMLCLELALLILVAMHAGWSLNPYMIGFDTNEYLTIGRNLAENQVYSRSSQVPFIPDFTRSPGYPFWLALIYSIFHSFKPAIFFGMIIFSLSAPLSYLIAREIFSEKLAFWSGIIFALEPRMAFSAPFLLSEQIFLPIFLLAIFFAVKFFVSPDNKKYILLSALALGISAPIRLISLFLWPFIAIFFFLELYKKQNIINSFKVLGFATLIFISFTLPWSVRNKLVIGTWQPSAIINTHLLGFLGTLRYHQNISQNENFQEVFQASQSMNRGDWKMLQSTNALIKESLKGIKSNWFAVIRIYILRAGFFFTVDGYKGIASYIINVEPHSTIGFTNFLTRLQFKEIFLAFRKFSISELVLPFLGRTIWFIITVLSFSGIFISYKRIADHRLILILFSFLVLYFASFTILTPEIDPRFRMPVKGIIFSFALVSVFYFFKLNFKRG